jgi:aminopeptidase N
MFRCTVDFQAALAYTVLSVFRTGPNMARSVKQLSLLVFLSASFLGVARAQHIEAYDERKLQVLEARRSVALGEALRSAASGSRSYDVAYYKLDIRIDLDPTRISGSVTVTAFSRSDSLSTVTLDLLNSMTVDSVTVDDMVRPFVQRPLTFDVDLGPPTPSGMLFTMIVYYRGIPSTLGLESFVSTTTPAGSPWIWTRSEPYGARAWWPCNDHPSDKADSVDVWITVPGTLKAGSQGLLVSVITNPDGSKTHRWRHRYPIATYLVSLAISDYNEYSFWFKHSPTDSMEVLNYMLPGTGLGSLPLTVDMLEIFTDLFGPYPFLAEKYGHAQFGWGGAMEHQTMTSTGSTGEGIIAHELAHQWFGDMITMQTWPHIWLNEGFATYGEILYRERRYGSAAYAVSMSGRVQSAMNATTPLYVSDTTNIGLLFSGALVYSKGAVVLHMLRHVVGDSLFFAAIKAYASDPRYIYGAATTEDLQEVFESATGEDLDYFFSEWVYGEFPQYSYSWRTEPQAGGHLLVIEISQTTGTPNPPHFTMPIDLRVVRAAMDTTVVVFNDQATQTFTMIVPFAPTDVVLDPGDWILKTASGTQLALKDGEIVPVQFELEQNFPNPFNASTTIPFGLGARSRVRLEVFDIIGRRLGRLVDQVQDAGFYIERWSANVPTGTYVVRLQANPLDGSVDGFTQARAMMVVR